MPKEWSICVTIFYFLLYNLQNNLGHQVQLSSNLFKAIRFAQYVKYDSETAKAGCLMYTCRVLPASLSMDSTESTHCDGQRASSSVTWDCEPTAYKEFPGSKHRHTFSCWCGKFTEET